MGGPAPRLDLRGWLARRLRCASLLRAAPAQDDERGVADHDE